MNGKRAKIIRKQIREMLRPGGILYGQKPIETGFYGRTFLHGGQRRAYQNAKALWQHGVRFV